LYLDNYSHVQLKLKYLPSYQNDIRPNDDMERNLCEF